MIIVNNSTVDTYKIQDLSTGNTSTGNLISTIWQGQNIGTGTGIYSGKTDHTLYFKSLNAGDNITLTDTASGVTIASTGGGMGTSGTQTVTSLFKISGPSVSFESTGVALSKAEIRNIGVGKLAFQASGGIILSDERSTKSGIQYGADYSANYTTRSLIDKGFANANYWNIAGTTTLGTTGVDILLPPNDATFLNMVSSNYGSGFNLGHTTAGSSYAVIGGTDAFVNFQSFLYFDLDNVLGYGGGVKFKDGRPTPLGIEYDNDYTATLGNRSLIDKGYADSRYIYDGVVRTYTNLSLGSSSGPLLYVGDSPFGDPSNKLEVSVNTNEPTSPFDNFENGLYLSSTGAKFGSYNVSTGAYEATLKALNGLIYAEGLPTTNPLKANALWNDAGVLKISAG